MPTPDLKILNLTIDEIMDRLTRLCRLGTSVMSRPTYPSGPSKWYVSIIGVQCPIHTGDMSGSNPQEAIHNTWRQITDPVRKPTLIRYFSKNDESVLGRGTQVWVRWSHKQDDWEDVEPDRIHPLFIAASDFRPYAEHKWREDNGHR